MSRLCPLTLAAIFAAVAAAQTAPNGDAIYEKTCARCHDGGGERAPTRAALKEMSAESIRFALTNGTMSKLDLGLSAAEIAAVSESASGKLISPTALPQQAFCAAGASFKASMATPHWNGWGVDVTQRRFQPAAMAQLSAESSAIAAG